MVTGADGGCRTATALTPDLPMPCNASAPDTAPAVSEAVQEGSEMWVVQEALRRKRR